MWAAACQHALTYKPAVGGAPLEAGWQICAACTQHLTCIAGHPRLTAPSPAHLGRINSLVDLPPCDRRRRKRVGCVARLNLTNIG